MKRQSTELKKDKIVDRQIMVRCNYRKWNNGKTDVQNYRIMERQMYRITELWKDRLFNNGIKEKVR